MEVWGAGGVAMGLNGARRAVLSHRAHHLTAVLSHHAHHLTTYYLPPPLA